jgi:hypothetical protein
MSVARGLERRLERFVDGMAARIFGGDIHPAELASRLLREADLAVTSAPAGPTAPNHFVIQASVDPESHDTTDLRQELAAVIEDAAEEQGWRLEGPATVELEGGAGTSITIATSVKPGARPAWGRLLGTDDRSRLDIRFNRILIGRSTECDLVVPHAPISRRHAHLWREAGRIWVGDLGSANGTFVNGEALVDPFEIFDADVVSFAESSHVLRLT